MTLQRVRPPASNLVLRAYRGPEDHPAMVDVASAVGALNGEPERRSVTDMDHYYANLEHADLPRDCTLVERDGLVVAYARASWEQMVDGERHVTSVLFVDPAHRGQGIEDLLVGHILRRSTELIPEIGAACRTRVMVFAGARDDDQRVVLDARGFVLGGHDAQLVRPDFEAIPELPLPEPFVLRPIDPDDRAMLRAVFDADARAFSESRGQEAPSEHQFQAWLDAPTFDPTLWRVAFDGDRIAGQILNYLGEPDEDDGSRIGWTEAISVQKEYRRRGLARALLAESIRAVRDAGASCAALGVDLNNPNHAVALYESLGYRIVSENYEYELGPFAPGARPNLVGSVAR